MIDKEFEQLKIAIAEGIEDLKNNRIHDSVSVFKSLRDKINELQK